MKPTPADPDAWNAYLAEGNAKQARKRVAADVLLRDTAGHILLVNPTYKPHWDLPGGMAEANEPPDAAVRRELRGELGSAITLHGLLVVDWVAPHGPWDDQIAFIFDGGTLDAGEGLCPHDEELSEARFVSPDKARELVGERMCRHWTPPCGHWTKDGWCTCTTARCATNSREIKSISPAVIASISTEAGGVSAHNSRGEGAGALTPKIPSA